MSLPNFVVLCNLLLNRRTATSICFTQLKKHTSSTFYFKIFLNYSKVGLCPLWQTRKKAIWRNLLSIQNEAISLVAMHSKEFWLVKKNHATVKLDSNGFSWNEKLQRKQNWTAKSTNVEENAEKINSVFVIRAALWAEKLECFLEYCWSWKNTLGKHAVAVNTGGHLIRALNETRRVTDGGNLCPLWLVILKLVGHGIGDTLWLQYSWSRAVVNYTFLAVVPWNGLEHSRRKVRLRVWF